jgi:Fe2+ transport system protein B
MMNNWKQIGSVFGLATVSYLYYSYKKSRRNVNVTVTMNEDTEVQQVNEEKEQEKVEQVEEQQQNDDNTNDITYEEITYISEREKQILDRVIREVIEDKKKEELEFLAYIVKNALSYC